MKTKSLIGSYIRTTQDIPFEEPKFRSGTILRVIHETMDVHDRMIVYILQEEKNGLITHHAWLGELDNSFFEVL